MTFVLVSKTIRRVIQFNLPSRKLPAKILLLSDTIAFGLLAESKYFIGIAGE